MKKRVLSIVVSMLTAALLAVLCMPCLAEDAADLTEGLVMYLSFDSVEEISGQQLILDESGYENHGTLLSGKIIEGKIGNA